MLEKYQTQLLKTFANGFNPTKIYALVACAIIQDDAGIIEPISIVQQAKISEKVAYYEPEKVAEDDQNEFQEELRR